MNEKLSSKDLFWSLLIIGLGMLVYGHSLTNGFCLDDAYYILDNPSIATLSGLAKMWSFPAIPFYDNPVTLTAFWLGHKLWAFHAWGYHTINLTFHILNALLLFGLVRRFAPVLAGITALLFTIHPIQVETVASISELKNMLCLFFFFLACHSFLDFENNGRKRDYFKTLFFFVACILSKITGVCFAAIPLLYAWRKDGKIPKGVLLRSLPFFFLGILSFLLPMHLQNVHSKDLEMPLFPNNIILAGKLFFFYIKQILLPLKFMTFYPKWDISVFHLANWIYPAAVISLYVAFYKNRHRWGENAFALLFFYGISIFPALGFFKITYFHNSYAADHFSYLSTPPLLLLFCGTGHLIYRKAQASMTRRNWAPPLLLKKSAAIILFLYLSLFSFHLSRGYKDLPTLWLQHLTQAPESPFGYYFMGVEIMRISPEKAVPFFEKAISLKSDYSKAYGILGIAYLKLGETEKAVRAFEEGLRLRPNDEIAIQNLETAQAALTQINAKN